MKKVIVIGVIALFVVVGFQPATANDIAVSKETTEENNESGDWGFGFILCSATYEREMDRNTYRLRWAVVECIDLETGNVVRQEKTGFFGFCLFKFLPMGRDYKLTVSTEDGDDWFIVRDLGFFSRAYLYYMIPF